MLELDFEYGFIEDTKACARAEHAVRKLKVGFWSMWFPSEHQLTHCWGALLMFNSKEKERRKLMYILIMKTFKCL